VRAFGLKHSNIVQQTSIVPGVVGLATDHGRYLFSCCAAMSYCTAVLHCATLQFCIGSTRMTAQSCAWLSVSVPVCRPQLQHVKCASCRCCAVCSIRLGKLLCVGVWPMSLVLAQNGQCSSATPNQLLCDYACRPATSCSKAQGALAGA